MKRLPFLLIYSRLIAALVIAALVWWPVANREWWIAGLMVYALISDIFDGIIARYYGVSSEKLRTWDSNADQVFWIITIAAVFWLNRGFIADHYPLILLVLGLELSAYAISYLRFKRTVATHSLMAKLWTLSLIVFLVDLCLNHSASWSFYLCIVLGLLSRLEIVAILLLLKKWATDIPGIWVIGKVNRGEPVAKSKLFNS